MPGKTLLNQHSVKTRLISTCFRIVGFLKALGDDQLLVMMLLFAHHGRSRVVKVVNKTKSYIRIVPKRVYGPTNNTVGFSRSNFF